MTDPQSPTAGKHLYAFHKLNKIPVTWEIRSAFENSISILQQKFVEHITLMRGPLFIMFIGTF
jgi:hypothetical protein